MERTKRLRKRRWCGWWLRARENKREREKEKRREKEKERENVCFSWEKNCSCSSSGGGWRRAQSTSRGTNFCCWCCGCLRGQERKRENERFFLLPRRTIKKTQHREAAAGFLSSSVLRMLRLCAEEKREKQKEKKRALFRPDSDASNERERSNKGKASRSCRCLRDEHSKTKKDSFRNYLIRKKKVLKNSGKKVTFFFVKGKRNQKKGKKN